MPASVSVVVLGAVGTSSEPGSWASRDVDRRAARGVPQQVRGQARRSTGRPSGRPARRPARAGVSTSRSTAGAGQVHDHARRPSRYAEQLQRAPGRRSARTQAAPSTAKTCGSDTPSPVSVMAVVGDVDGAGGRRAAYAADFAASWLDERRRTARCASATPCRPCRRGRPGRPVGDARRRPPRRRRGPARPRPGCPGAARGSPPTTSMSLFGVRRDLRAERGHADLVGPGVARAKVGVAERDHQHPRRPRRSRRRCRLPPTSTETLPSKWSAGWPGAARARSPGRRQRRRSWGPSSLPGAAAAGTHPSTADARRQACDGGPREGVAAWGRHAPMLTSPVQSAGEWPNSADVAWGYLRHSRARANRVSRSPCRPTAGSRRPRRPGRPCRPRRPCPRRAGRRPSCCRPRRRP